MENLTGETNETITLTDEEIQKKIQGAEDKVRTEYSKKIKTLEEELKTLKPKEKSKSEIEIGRAHV